MSNVIKPGRYIAVDEIRKLEAAAVHPPKPQAAPETNALAAQEVTEAKAIADKIVQDAKAAADEQILLAAQEAERIRAEAQEEAEKWWAERRAEDERVREEGRQEGFAAGYEDGRRKAEEEVNAAYEAKLRQAADLVEEAHRVKEQIIAEAEPFLVELATEIARKIIGEHLQADPHWTADHVKRLLSRRRDKSSITLCVSPAEFPKMAEIRTELMMAVDSQAELKIVPDATVDDGGCVIRTEFGSIDARIDTQLSEIRTALLEAAASGGEGAQER